MWKRYGTTEETTDENLIQRMRFAWWVTKATSTSSEYVISIDLPRQQWLIRKRLSITLYVHYLHSCIVLLRHALRRVKF
jgi:hypothetical protein